MIAADKTSLADNWFWYNPNLFFCLVNAALVLQLLIQTMSLLKSTCLSQIGQVALGAAYNLSLFSQIACPTQSINQ